MVATSNVVATSNASSCHRKSCIASFLAHLAVGLNCFQAEFPQDLWTWGTLVRQDVVQVLLGNIQLGGSGFLRAAPLHESFQPTQHFYAVHCDRLADQHIRLKVELYASAELSDYCATMRKNKPKPPVGRPFESLPQIGLTTEQCAPIERQLNERGRYGWLLQSIVADHRFAFAAQLETDRKWEYRVLQFNMRDPLACERLNNRLGEDGYLLLTVYSQGVNNFATVAVFVRPSGEPADTTIESDDFDDERTVLTETASNVAATVA